VAKPFRLKAAATLFASLLLATLVTSASASRQDLDVAWQDYADNRAAIEPAFKFPHASCFSAAALQHDLPESLLLAVARGESDFEATARSRANAHGVMQILWPGYLKELLGRYDGNLHLALAAYNYGPGRISQDGRGVPPGAAWYSGYILRHLNYVLGNGGVRPTVPDTLYSEIGQSTLLTFGEPYRAEAFIERLERDAADLSLDWFRRGTGEFEVVMTYADRDEFDRSARQLALAGFRID
jgi:hypothetical protein